MSEIKGYEFIEEESDTITCDYCNKIFSKCYRDFTHTLCRSCLINKVVIEESV